MISGQREMVPEVKRLIIARAVSKKNSNMGLGNWESGAATVGPPWLSHAAMQGVVGWMNTLALRRCSSSKMGSNVLSPR